MASSSLILAVAPVLLLLLLSSLPSLSATCTSQTFSKNRIFKLCRDLPTLNTSLHWTYSSSDSTLSIAFIASPAKPDGWISWGINPTATGMIGSQALLAYRQPNGTVFVNTYNISSFSPIVSPIAFNVSDMAAESSDDVLTIFATLSLPKGGNTIVNHVWQVGPAMSGSSPLKHAMEPPNLNAKGSLDFLKGDNSGGSNGTSGGNSTNTTPSSAVPVHGGLLSSLPLMLGASLVSLLLVVVA